MMFGRAVLAAALLPGLLGVGCRREAERAASHGASARGAPMVLAEASGDEHTLKVQVLELKRVSPATVWLKMSLVNASTGPGSIDLSQRFASEPPDRGTIADVYLAEPGNARKLFVLRDDANRPNCSEGLTALSSGARTEVWGKFPAPPPGVTRLEVHVPLFAPMTVSLGRQEPHAGA